MEYTYSDSTLSTNVIPRLSKLTKKMQGPSGSCPGCQPVRALRRHWNNRKYVADKLHFHVHKNLSGKYEHFGHARSTLFASPLLGRKSLKDIISKRQQISGLFGATTYLGPALCEGQPGFYRE